MSATVADLNPKTLDNARRQFVELYAVPSWEEHLRQHSERLTRTDQQYEEEAQAYAAGPGDTSHLIAVELPEVDA